MKDSDEEDMRGALSLVKGDKLRIRLFKSYSYDVLWAALGELRSGYSPSKTLEQWFLEVLFLPILAKDGETMKILQKKTPKKLCKALHLHSAEGLLGVQMWETVVVNTEGDKSYTPMLYGKFEPTKTRKGINRDLYIALWQSNESNKIPGKNFTCFISDASLLETECLSVAKSFKLDWSCAYCAKLVFCNKCSGCRKVRYCNIACQQADRAKHAPTCYHT